MLFLFIITLALCSQGATVQRSFPLDTRPANERGVRSRNGGPPLADIHQRALDDIAFDGHDAVHLVVNRTAWPHYSPIAASNIGLESRQASEKRNSSAAMPNCPPDPTSSPTQCSTHHCNASNTRRVCQAFIDAGIVPLHMAEVPGALAELYWLFAQSAECSGERPEMCSLTRADLGNRLSAARIAR